jgi:hypothetical protein
MTWFTREELCDVVADEINRYKIYGFKRHWRQDADYLLLKKHEQVLKSRFSRAQRVGYFRKQPKPGRPRVTKVDWRQTKAQRIALAAKLANDRKEAARAFFGM